jgi:hypothetical protein
MLLHCSCTGILNAQAALMYALQIKDHALCMALVRIHNFPSIAPSSLPACVLQYLVCLLLAWVGLHGAHSPGFVALLACELLLLLCGGSADGPVELTEYVGFDGFNMS